MKARHALLILLAFSVGFAGLVEARGRARRGEVNLTEEQKAQFQARREAMQQDGQCSLQPRGGAGFSGALELSDEQKTQLQELMQPHREAMQAIRTQVQDGSLTRDEARTKIEALRETHRAEMQKILTQEQLDKIEELRANRPQRGRWGAAGEGEEGDVVTTEAAMKIGESAPTSVESQSWGNIKKQQAE